MVPTIVPGQIVIASSLKKPNINSVVILRHQGIEKLKRITEIEKNNVYVVGDNTLKSTDSKQFGWLPMSSVVATVIWPNYQQKR